MAANENEAGARPVVKELTFTRVFNAPRELVFQAWTDPQLTAQWWGPRCFTNALCEVDARPGGTMRIVMRAPDGVEYALRGLFHEVLAPERIVVEFFVMEEEHPGDPQLQSLHTVTFVETDGKTKLTMLAQVTKATAFAAEALAGMQQGWDECLDRLGEFIAQGRVES